jgi:ribosomal protein S17E
MCQKKSIYKKISKKIINFFQNRLTKNFVYSNMNIVNSKGAVDTHRGGAVCPQRLF